jgi:tyrosine-protein kinase
VKSQGECWYRIDDGPNFEGLENVLAHYTRQNDGLPTQLSKAMIPAQRPRKLEEANTALHTACLRAQSDKIASLLKKEQPNERNRCGRTPLHEAVRSGSAGCVQTLIKHGSSKHLDLDAVDDLNWTPLHIAAYEGMDEVVKVLVFNGANIHEKTVDYETPLALASRMGNVESSKILGFADNGITSADKFQLRDFAWMHGKINRQAAENILEKNNNTTGLFLVRESSQRASNFVLSMCDGGSPFHYQIQADFSGGRRNCYFIDDGPVFEGLPKVIEYYRNNPDGLPCKLKQYCRVGSGSGRPIALVSLGGDTSQVSEGGGVGGGGARGGGVSGGGGDDSDSDEGPDDYNRIEKVDAGRDLSISSKAIRTGSLLGEGEFGQVLQATWTDPKRAAKGKMEVAVKTLRDAGSMSEASHKEFLREARLMEKLVHRYVVRLFGYVWGEGANSSKISMIVQELVALGALLGYLEESKNEPELKANNCSRMILYGTQVAVGMEYLETVNFVHRDLATRNILVASVDLVKISDFGLSRTIAVEDDYYTASAGGKWPVKWYAPESVYYGKFTSLSDVWSFGVTLWEIWNFGILPYGEKTGREVLEGIEKGERLDAKGISPEVYKVMMSCWEYDKPKRRPFRELKQDLYKLLSPSVQKKVEL